jgi:uncharacterized protein (DUF58 family)
VAACLVFSAVADQVNTGFIAFSDHVLTYQPPRRSRARAWTMLEEIWALRPKHKPTALLPTARFLSAQLKSVSMVFIVSDFMTDEDWSGARDLKALAVRHDVIAVVLEDPAEISLPRGSGSMTLRDLESGRHVRVGFGEDFRARYEELLRQRRRDLVDAFYRLQIDHVFLRSDQNVIEPLLRLFALRRHA